MGQVREPAVRLREELNRQLDIQAKLGEALLKELTSTVDKGRPVLDQHGEVVDNRFVPDREWSRVYGHYRGANKDLLAEERERTKLRLLVDGGDRRVLTDEDYEREMRVLSMESVKQLSDAELEAELVARGISVDDVKERE